jgi:hypothetical protein
MDQRTKICPNHSRFESQVKCDKSIGTGFSKQENFKLRASGDNQQQNHQKITTHFANHLKMMIQWSMKVSND